MTLSPTLRSGSAALIGPAVIVLVGLVASTDPFWTYLATTAAIAYILTASFNIVYGYAGVFSMAHVALFGVGAYSGVLLEMRLDVPFPIATLGAMAAAGLLGFFLWWPTRALRDLYLAIATLGFAVMAEELIQKWTSITGGGQGLLGIPPANVFGEDLFSGDLSFFWLVGLGGAFAWEITRRLDRSGLGRRMVAYRDAPVALASTGESPQRIRAIAFVLSSVLAGLAGTLFAHHTLFISSESFGLGRLIELVLAALLGGLGTRLGPLIGVAALLAIDELGASFVEWRELIFGVAIIVLLGYSPGGVVGMVKRVFPTRASRESARRSERATLSELVGEHDASTLAARHITVEFGGVRALDDVSFEVRSGQVLGLIGPNGAGKTTLLNSLTGHIVIKAGDASLGGDPIIDRRSFMVARRGIARTFQTPHLVPDDTVVDNVMIGSAQRRTASTIEEVLDIGRAPADTARASARAADLLEWFGVADLADARASEQPYSVSKFVEIARSVAMQPDFILMDEPGAGLTDEERSRLVTVIRELAASGIGIVLIDHNVSFVRDASDQMLALDGGRVIAHGEPDAVFASPEVVQAYLGGTSHG